MVDDIYEMNGSGDVKQRFKLANNQAKKAQKAMMDATFQV